MNTPIRKKELIKAERLTLRPMTEKDTDALVSLLRDPVITKTFMVPLYETRAEYEALAAKLIEFSRPEDTVHLQYAVCLGERLIGFVNDCGIEEDSIEIGYVIDPVFHGHGYATEAVKAILPELREMGFRRVEAGYFEENPASLRVMEKCGMHRTGKAETGEYRGQTHRCLYCEIEL